MQAPTKSEAEAWLEESAHYKQTRRHNDEESEHLSGNEEALEDSDERDEYPEEEYEEEIEEDEEGEGEHEEEEIEEDEEGEEGEGDGEGEEEVQETEEHQEEQAQNRDHEENGENEGRGHRAAGKNQARLPYGSPVKRAHTANDHRRNTSRVLTSQRDKSAFETKFASERYMFERLTGKSLSPTRAPEEFLEYYEKFCKGFLLKKEEELEKKRRQKEEDELAQLQDKPTLISRPQSKPYVPLLERTPLLNAKRERELEKIKQEKEEKLQRELEEATFKPKINPRSKNLATSPTRERIMNVYLRSRNQYNSQSPFTPRKADRDAFQPKINPNSRNIVQAMRENAGKDVVERLYHKADLGRAKKSELAKQLTPKFTPSLNKNTRKIAKQIEANYYNEHNNDPRQLSETKRDKRKRSELESNRTSQHYREESHMEQASDLELLDILKQFNSMLEQKNEVPINLQQLSSLMTAYSGKKKADLAETVKPYKRDHIEGHHEQYEEEEEEHGQEIRRSTHTERSKKNYVPVPEEDSNPMFSNIEKNLMHIQGSLQDLKENGNQGASESLSSLHHKSGVHHNEMQSSSHSLNKSKKSKHNDYHREGNDRDQHIEYVESEVMQSKNSIATGRNQPASSHHEKNMNMSAKSQKSNSHLSPSKHEVHDVEEVKSLAARSAKKEDYSSPETQKTSRKRAQTTTKKTKKTKVSPRFEGESQNLIKTIKDARSLNDVLAHTVESKNSLEGWNSQFDAHDNQFEVIRENQNQQEKKVKSHHVAEHSFGGYPKDAVQQGLVQEDDNYRSNHPSETSKPKSGFGKKSHVDNVKDKDKEKWRSSQALREQEKGEALIGDDYDKGKANSQAYIAQAKNQASQNSIAGSNKKSEKKEQQSQKSYSEKAEKSEKSVKEKRGRNQEDTQHRKGSANSRDQNKKYSNTQEDKSIKTGSEYDHEDKNRPKSGRGSRKVSFEAQSDSRRSSIYQEGSDDRHVTGQSKGSLSGKKKSPHAHDQGQHHSEKISTFANKQQSNKQSSKHRHEEEHNRASEEDEVQSSIHGGTPKVRSGDYMSFSANTLDQQPSFDDHQPPQNDRRHMEDYESEGSKAHSIKQGGIRSIQGSPNKHHRGEKFEVVTTETIQIEPQSAPRFSYAMDGTDKAIPTASSSGLKAMAEQIVKKFKAYDAQIKQTAREYKMSVSPPRTASPSPEHNESPHELEEPKKEKESKVFKSVEKGGVAKSSRNEIRPSRGSIPGSLSSVQSGVDRRHGKKY